MLDLPVGAGDRGMTRSQRVSLDGFLDGYDRSAAPVLTITVPAGSGNELAAADAASDIRQSLRCPRHPLRTRIVMASYQAPSVDVSAPVRVSYHGDAGADQQMRALARRPAETTSKTSTTPNFGCSYQNNLAAQIDNPADLLGPRKQTADRRGESRSM